MAVLHQEFCKFHDRIALTGGKKSTLRVVRDTLRQRVRKYFRSTLRVEAPKFLGQGSFAMDTAVNPINKAHGIDDGICLRHLDRRDAGNWPAPAVVHRWLVNAADGHACHRPIDRRAWVRVRYDERYHVDLRAYGELNGQYLMAVKGEAGWRRSDPSALTDWFGSYVHQRGEQLRRIVRYLKAWADFQSMMHRGKMADALILTVLAAHHFHGHYRDDLALAKTIEAVSDAVRTVFFVLNPVNITEELTERLTDKQKERFKTAVQAFAVDANGALSIEDDHKASKLWRKQLGDRFP